MVELLMLAFAHARVGSCLALILTFLGHAVGVST